MALPPHARDWMERAEIDYIGPFVKAWAAFNAWYRNDSGETPLFCAVRCLMKRRHSHPSSRHWL